MTDAISYFSAKLAHETDASDVYAAQKDGEAFVLIDVRSDAAWKQGRIAGAIHLRRQEIAERAAGELDPAVPVVVYCWSPGCNAGAKAALECQWPFRTARGRPAELPAGGHGNCPLMA
ncbi:rhodanese-like domain-containing protein, partial [Microbacterium sp.]|uniref:rhodanese-like domain-containing protein n=1 Tax=Microbacterium sp. TaxID=51671 RepID=UPI0025CF0B99